MMMIFSGFQEIHSSSPIFLQGTIVAFHNPQFNSRRVLLCLPESQKKEIAYHFLLLYRFLVLNWNSWQII